MVNNEVIFTNDDNVTISLIDHHFSSLLEKRDNHEVLFRQINTYLIKQNIIKNNIIDLGAWIGDNSMPWAKNIKGIVYAIDPSPENCQFIRDTCILNNINNVNVIQSAISNSNEILSTNDDLQHCSFEYDKLGTTGNIKVDAVSLDYLYETSTIENIGYIHLDVEGMEYKVIEGSDKLINECRPIISFEQHLNIDNYNAILSILQNKNYKVFLIDEILPGCRIDCRNSLAFPNEIFNEALIQDIHTHIGQSILIPK